MDTIKNGALGLYNSFNWKDNKDAKAFLKLVASRGSFTVYGALYATLALNELAKRTEDCDGKIFGGTLKTSSAISSVVFIEGAITAVLSPLWGVIADNTSHRKLMFMLAHTFWILLVLVQMLLVSDETPAEEIYIYFVVSIVVMSIALELAIVLLTAYLPEITVDEHDLYGLTGRSYAFNNSMQLLLALLTTLIGIVFGISDLDNEAFVLAQVAGGITIGFWLIYSIPGFMLLSERKKEVLKNQKCHSSLIRLKNVFGEIISTYPQVGVYLVSYMFFFAGVGNMVSLATTFLLNGVGLASFTVSVASALLLIFAVIGALIVAPLLKRMDLKRAYVLCISFWLVITTAGPFAMNGEVTGIQNKTEDFNPRNCPLGTEEVVEPAEGAVFIVFLFAALYGIGIGTSFSLTTSIFALIIPGGSEAGYFGLKTVFSKLAVWAPALCYTAVNESLDKDGEKYAFLTIAPFFALGLLFAFILDFEKARNDIEHTLEHRHVGHGGENEKKTEEVRSMSL